MPPVDEIVISLPLLLKLIPLPEVSLRVSLLSVAVIVLPLTLIFLKILWLEPLSEFDTVKPSIVIPSPPTSSMTPFCPPIDTTPFMEIVGVCPLETVTPVPALIPYKMLEAKTLPSLASIVMPFAFIS